MQPLDIVFVEPHHSVHGVSRFVYLSDYKSNGDIKLATIYLPQDDGDSFRVVWQPSGCPTFCFPSAESAQRYVNRCARNILPLIDSAAEVA